MVGAITYYRVIAICNSALVLACMQSSCDYSLQLILLHLNKKNSNEVCFESYTSGNGEYDKVSARTIEVPFLYTTFNEYRCIHIIRHCIPYSLFDAFASGLLKIVSSGCWSLCIQLKVYHTTISPNSHKRNELQQFEPTRPHFIIPRQRKLKGDIGMLRSVRPSVFPSVRPSVHPLHL